MMFSSFPNRRGRRLRQNNGIRALVRETSLSKSDLISPIFVREGKNIVEKIPTMPGINRYSIDELIRYVEKLMSAGILAVALFPYTPEHKKSSKCEEAWNSENLVNKATRLLKQNYPQLIVMLDVALDPYTSHGHDGILSKGKILNDETVKILVRQSLLQAEMGCDVISPSDMMDGRVGEIRKILDKNNFIDVSILSYAVKYASNFYGPFRDAVGSKNILKGNKKNYQMDFRNSDEALREVALDIKEGADMVMVKPGMPYLDIIKSVKEKFKIPVFAYQVSGEYTLLSNAIGKGLINNDAILESLISFKRSGANAIVSYYADRIDKILD